MCLQRGLQPYLAGTRAAVAPRAAAPCGASGGNAGAPPSCWARWSEYTRSYSLRLTVWNCWTCSKFEYCPGVVCLVWVAATCQITPGLARWHSRRTLHLLDSSTRPDPRPGRQNSLRPPLLFLALHRRNQSLLAIGSPSMAITSISETERADGTRS